jgi:hypothetical protein
MPFPKRLLASQGLICVAEARDGEGFNHYFVDTFDEAQHRIDRLAASGKTIYLAQATSYASRLELAVAAGKLPLVGVSPKERIALLRRVLTETMQAAKAPNKVTIKPIQQGWEVTTRVPARKEGK